MGEMSRNVSVVKNIIWKLAERMSSQGIAFIISIIIARLLSPNEYGIIAITTVFIAIANVFVQGGFNTALVQKKDSDNKDFSSVFFLSIFITVFIYGIIFVCAPFVSEFYKIPQLVEILRVLGLILFVNVFNSLQTALIMKKMEFKKLFYSSLIGVIISGSAGIYTAYIGWGVWALVIQQLLNQFIISIVLIFLVKWKPILYFSRERVRPLFSFGWKILCSNLIDTVYMNMYNLCIGKIYNKYVLGLYNQGNTYPNLIVSNINGAIQSVMLPVFAERQDDLNLMKNALRRTIKFTSYIIFPMMFGLAAIAEPLVSVLLTSKWLECVFFLQVGCITYAFWPLHSANLQAINALGRSDIFLKLELIKKTLGVTMLIVCIPFGVRAMAIGQACISIISVGINAFPNKKLLSYSIKEQVNDIKESLLLSIIMSISVYCITMLPFPDALLIVIAILSGAIIYILLSLVRKNENYYYILNNINEFRKGNLK